jgi:hypothetical protein
MTSYMHDWWESVVSELGFRPTIVQGAFMTRNGGGAAASAGYHDQGGCIDVRTWDLSGSQIDALVRVCRSRGGAAWRRDETAAHGGMDSHCHITLGSDRPLSPGAAESWRSYLAGDNGLANNARDYEWRPNPIVTNPPEEDMPYTEQKLTEIMRKAIRAELASFKQNQRATLHDLGDQLDAIEAAVKDDATRKQVQRVRADLKALVDDTADPSEG